MAWYKIVVEDHFTSQATNLSSHVRVVNRTIKEKLTKSQFRMFMTSVFGRFVDMDRVAPLATIF